MIAKKKLHYFNYGSTNPNISLSAIHIATFYIYVKGVYTT